MSKAIAIFNQAGGVGKTTLTHNLGYHLARRCGHLTGLKELQAPCPSHSVLLVDLDPQASLTTFMGIDTESLEQTPFDALINEEPLFILKDIQGIDLAPTLEILDRLATQIEKL